MMTSYLLVAIWLATFYTQIRDNITALLQDLALLGAVILAGVLKIIVQIVFRCKRMFI